MAETHVKMINLADVRIERSLNPRHELEYNVEALENAVVAKGEIIDPPHLEEVTLPDGTKYLRVLKGFLRLTVAQKLLANPAIAANLKSNLQKTRCIIHSDLTPEERDQIIMDHGSQKQLSHAGTALAVWKLRTQGMSVRQIIDRMYYSLAKFGGSSFEKKLAELPKQEPERGKRLGTWFNGTLNALILRALDFDSYIKDQFILYLLDEKDGILPKESKEKRELHLGQAQLSALSVAKNEDEERVDKNDPTSPFKNGGWGWTAEKGGLRYNEVLKQLKEQFVNGRRTLSDNRMSAKALAQAKTAAVSDLAKMVYAAVSGETAAAERLNDVDAKTARNDAILLALGKAEASGTLPVVFDSKDFVRHLLDDSPAGFGNYLTAAKERDVQRIKDEADKAIRMEEREKHIKELSAEVETLRAKLNNQQKPQAVKKS